MSAASYDSQPPVFVLVAGEASGDQLGARLIQGLQQRFPDARFSGIGGPAMAAAGCELWWDTDTLAVMGLVEVLRHLPRLLRLKRALIRRVLAQRPAAFIGIDSPDFNLRVARRVRAAGIPTVQYVCPTVWAWRPRRVHGIRRAVDRVLCLYPFEPEYLDQHRISASFVGHPLAARLSPNPDRRPARANLGLPEKGPVLALLPGSRRGEVRRMGPLLARAAAMITARHPDTAWVTALASGATRDTFFAALVEAGLRPDQVRLADKATDALEAADFALAASGTVTLEAALLGRPAIVVYRVAPATHFLLRTLGMLKLDRVALPNILSGRELLPELLQADASPRALTRAALVWLEDPTRREGIEEQLKELHDTLRGEGDNAAAHAIATMIERQ